MSTSKINLLRVLMLVRRRSCAMAERIIPIMHYVRYIFIYPYLSQEGLELVPPLTAATYYIYNIIFIFFIHKPGAMHWEALPPPLIISETRYNGCGCSKKKTAWFFCKQANIIICCCRSGFVAALQLMWTCSFPPRINILK